MYDSNTIAEKETTKASIPITTKIVNGMTYKISFHFSKITKETFRDKIMRLITNDMSQKSI